jgi:hypothetical protein
MDLLRRKVPLLPIRCCCCWSWGRLQVDAGLDPSCDAVRIAPILLAVASLLFLVPLFQLSPAQDGDVVVFCCRGSTTWLPKPVPHVRHAYFPFCHPPPADQSIGLIVYHCCCFLLILHVSFIERGP